MQSSNLIYDGTFEGFLTCVFTAYEYKLKQIHIQNQNAVQQLLFASSQNIISDPQKAIRVWKGIQKKSPNAGIYPLYYAFLSEKEQIENLLLDYIQHIFRSNKPIEKDYANPTVLKLSQIAKKVSREKHRMESFVRFRQTKDAIFFASIEPDFNVLPLISTHFTNRFADQKWIIYDVSRKYGLCYDLTKTELIQLEFPKGFDPTKTSSEYFANEEFEFQKLWQDYFKSATIASRKNTKLHVQYMPARYWKYLSEKQP